MLLEETNEKSKQPSTCGTAFLAEEVSNKNNVYSPQLRVERSEVALKFAWVYVASRKYLAK